jgi:phosphoribosyl-AMP cyclohydrolase
MPDINAADIKFPFKNLKLREIDGIKGLITAVAQDYRTEKILMVAYMNKEAIEKTIATGNVHYYSTSRKKLWMKGEHSGNVQRVREIYLDCDGDAILLTVEQNGGACHEGYRSCFFRKLNKEGRMETIGERMFDPKDVY